MRNERRKRAGTVSRKTGPAEKLRGANLGNWLVLEKWMQPSMFAGTDAEDETWYHRRMQKDPELRERLRRHRETYVTEEDFRRIIRDYPPDSVGSEGINFDGTYFYLNSFAAHYRMTPEECFGEQRIERLFYQ